MPDSQVGYVLMCTAYDSQAGQCTQTTFVPPPSALPQLSVEDANTIGFGLMAAVASVMASKLLRRG